jgi:hypothetical protein
MKRLTLAGIVTLAFALGALAQGSINLNNSFGINYGVATDTAGNYYSGTYGIEVWELSGVSSVPAGINLTPGTGSGVTAFVHMAADGFKLEATFADQTMSVGTITIGEVDMPDVTPAGSTVVVALAAWNNSAASWSAMAASATGTTRTGVIAFLNPTANYSVPPAPTPPNITGWNSVSDLVMTAIPEPDALALAGVGVVVVLLLRRRFIAKLSS